MRQLFPIWVLVGALATNAAAQASPLEPLDLNLATEAQLRTLPGIGPKRAQKIIERRRRRPFRRVRELLRVPGIGPKRFARLRSAVRVEPPVTPRPRLPRRRRRRSKPRRESAVRECRWWTPQGSTVSE